MTIITKKYAVGSAINFSTKTYFTAYYLHRDHPPAWELSFFTKHVLSKPLLVKINSLELPSILENWVLFLELIWTVCVAVAS